MVRTGNFTKCVKNTEDRNLPEVEKYGQGNDKGDKGHTESHVVNDPVRFRW